MIYVTSDLRGYPLGKFKNFLKKSWVIMTLSKKN